MAMAVLALFTQSQTACAQQGADELAKKLSNPVAALIAVPMQYNIDFDIGSESGTKQYLNVQPVIPRGLTDTLNLITRVIVPVIYQDDVFGDSGPVRSRGHHAVVLLLAEGAGCGRLDRRRRAGFSATDGDGRAPGR